MTKSILKPDQPEILPLVALCLSNTKSKSIMTRRQQEILALVAEGLANKEIARRLCITTSTVKAHLQEIYKRLNGKKRVEASIWWELHTVDTEDPH